MNRIYPRTIWVLTPSFKPKAVEVVQVYRSFREDYGDQTATGKCYLPSDMFDSQADAIANGRARVKRMAADLQKKQESLKKKIEVLDKAEKDAS